MVEERDFKLCSVSPVPLLSWILYLQQLQGEDFYSHLGPRATLRGHCPRGERVPAQVQGQVPVAEIVQGTEQVPRQSTNGRKCTHDRGGELALQDPVARPDPVAPRTAAI